MTPRLTTQRIRRKASRRGAVQRERHKAVMAAVAKAERDTARKVSLTLSNPPLSANGLYANRRGGGRVKTADYRVWLITGMVELRTVQRSPLVPGPVTITYLIKRTNGRRDLDNCAKSLCDLLVKANVIEDDSKVEKITMEWHPDVEGVEIEVRSA